MNDQERIKALDIFCRTTGGVPVGRTDWKLLERMADWIASGKTPEFNSPPDGSVHKPLEVDPRGFMGGGPLGAERPS
jgi:hypothetical protein